MQKLLEGLGNTLLQNLYFIGFGTTFGAWLTSSPGFFLNHEAVLRDLGVLVAALATLLAAWSRSMKERSEAQLNLIKAELLMKGSCNPEKIMAIINRLEQQDKTLIEKEKYETDR